MAAIIGRRQLVTVAIWSGASASACATFGDEAPPHDRAKGGEPAAEVNPAEDLMQEHGVLQRPA